MFKRTTLTLVVLVAGLLLPRQPIIAGPTDSDFQALSLDSLLDAPVSVAAKYRQTASQAPASVTIVTAEEIRRFGWHTLAEVLNNISGFYITDDRAYQYVGVRGFSRPSDYNNRVLVMVDGHTVRENLYASAPIDMQFWPDLSFIKRVEIVRGPGSVVNGDGAMFATINIVTNDAGEIRGSRYGLDVSSDLGRQLRMQAGTTLKNGLLFSASAHATQSNGQNFALPNDENSNSLNIRHLDWMSNFGGHLQARFKNWKFTSLLTSGTKGVPTSSWDTTPGDGRSRYHDGWFFGELSNSLRLSGAASLETRAFSDYYAYHAVYPYDPAGEDQIENAGNLRLGAESHVTLSAGAGHRIVGGAEYSDETLAKIKNWTKSSILYSRNTPFSAWSLYFQDEFSATEHLSLSAGLRQFWHARGALNLVPRAAIVWSPLRATTAKLLYGEAIRVPSTYERDWEDNETEIANHNLKSEHIKTYELIVEQRPRPELFFSGSLFSYKVNNLIDPVIDEASGLVQFRNTSAAKATGSELTLTYRPHNGLLANLSHAHLFTAQTENGDPLSNSPEHETKVALSVPVRSVMTTGVEWINESSRLTLADTRTAEFSIVNATVATYGNWSPVRASLSVRNLFDVKYEYPGGWEHIAPMSTHSLPGIPQRGRTATVSLDYSF